jgi:hypothetical protein
MTMSPLDAIYCWQALLIAVLASGSTQLLKKISDILRGIVEDSDGNVDIWEAIGKELRRDAVIWNKIVMPSAVVFFGAFWAALLPVRPEALIEYTVTHAPGWRSYLVYAGWGAACGQFADYGFSKLKELLGGVAARSPNAD